MKHSKEDSGVDPYRTNAAKARQRFKEVGGDDKFWKPQQGKSTIRICPPWGPTANGVFYLAGALHYGFKIGGRDRAIACRAFSEKGPCAVCEVISMAKESGDEELSDVVEELRMRKKFWVNLVDRENPKRVKIYGGNKKFIEEVLAAMDDPDLGDVTDPANGHDFTVVREGSGKFDTRYTWRPRVKASPLGLVNMKKKLHKLDQVVLEFMTYEEAMKTIASSYPDLASELGLTPKKKSRKAGDSKFKKKPKDEDEDEEEEKDDEGENEDQDDDDDEEE